jgi:hypothetical protein
MGYPIGHKVYKLYDLNQEKFIISHNVSFNEHKFPFENSVNDIFDFPITTKVNNKNLIDPIQVNSQNVTHKI